MSPFWSTFGLLTEENRTFHIFLVLLAITLIIIIILLFLLRNSILLKICSKVIYEIRPYILLIQKEKYLYAQFFVLMLNNDMHTCIIYMYGCIYVYAWSIYLMCVYMYIFYRIYLTYILIYNKYLVANLRIVQLVKTNTLDQAVKCLNSPSPHCWTLQKRKKSTSLHLDYVFFVPLTSNPTDEKLVVLECITSETLCTISDCFPNLYIFSILNNTS